MVFVYHALRTMTDDSSDIFQSFPSWLLEAKLVLLTQPLWRIYSVGISWAMLHLFFFSPKNHPISSFGINSMLVKQYDNASNSTHLWWFPETNSRVCPSLGMSRWKARLVAFQPATGTTFQLQRRFFQLGALAEPRSGCDDFKGNFKCVII